MHWYEHFVDKCRFSVTSDTRPLETHLLTTAFFFAYQYCSFSHWYQPCINRYRLSSNRCRSQPFSYRYRLFVNQYRPFPYRYQSIANRLGFSAKTILVHHSPIQALWQSLLAMLWQYSTPYHSIICMSILNYFPAKFSGRAQDSRSGDRRIPQGARPSQDLYFLQRCVNAGKEPRLQSSSVTNLTFKNLFHNRC